MAIKRVFTSIIELQASWIAINPIQGCPMQCKYCFLNQSIKMNKISETPNFDAHVFICTHERDAKKVNPTEPQPSKQKCCFASGGAELRKLLKESCAQDSHLKKRVRINASGCLGQCENGIACVIYPKSEWHLNLQLSDVDFLRERIKKALEQVDEKTNLKTNLKTNRKS